jgi:hypothetical protein
MRVHPRAIDIDWTSDMNDTTAHIKCSYCDTIIDMEFNDRLLERDASSR